MRASRIFNNGRDKYEVICSFSDSLCSPRWNITVYKKPKGKRKFVELVDSDSWEMRQIDLKERDRYRFRKYLEEIPWAWVDMVMGDVVTEIRRLGNELYPKDE